MKTKFYLLQTGIILLVLNSCEQKKKIETKLNFQQKFLSLVESSERNYSSQPNDIKKEEYLKKYDDNISKFLKDSAVIQNWTGTVDGISSNEINGFKVIDLEIKERMKADDDLKQVSFKTSYIIKQDDINSDALYKQISSLTDGGMVYFTGFFAKNEQNKIKPIVDGMSRYNSFDYFITPTYKFYVLSVSNKQNPKLSANLIQVLKLDREIFDLLNEKVAKKISEKDWKSKTKELTTKAEEIEKKLTQSEKYYSKLSKQYLSMEFI